MPYQTYKIKIKNQNNVNWTLPQKVFIKRSGKIKKVKKDENLFRRKRIKTKLAK